MPKTDFFKKLADELANAIPSHIGALKNDFEKNCHQILTSAFRKLDLVTREEFDTQTKVLLRTRKKLDDLEKHLKEIESRLKKKETK